MLFTLCTTITPEPTTERGFVLMLLRPAAPVRRYAGFQRDLPSPEPRWERYPQRFACKNWALRKMRANIRTGTAVAAKLYHGGTLTHYYCRGEDGREVRMAVQDMS